MRELVFYSQEHLGDNVYAILFMRMIVKYNDVHIKFYVVNHSYIEELKKHIVGYENKIDIILTPINQHLLNNNNIGIQSHGDWSDFVAEHKNENGEIEYNKFYVYFYKKMAERLGLNLPISIDDILFDYPEILNKNDLSGKIDILLINSAPKSNQVKDYNHTYFNFIIDRYKDKKIITTQKILNLPCTSDYKLSLIDIANLSLNCEVVVGIHTAPFILTLNKFNIDNKMKWIIIQNDKISYKNDKLYSFTSVKGNENEILKLIDSLR